MTQQPGKNAKNEWTSQKFKAENPPAYLNFHPSSLSCSLSLSLFSPSLFLSISQPTPPSTPPRSFSSSPPLYFLNSESRRYLHFSVSSGCNHGRTLRWHLLSGSVAARWGTASPFETYAFLATDAGRRTHVRRIFRV